MRFHHSTRRGRNRLGHHNQHPVSHRLALHSSTSTSRWSQLGYCRETNIHFNRRLPVEPPPPPPPTTSTTINSSQLALETGGGFTTSSIASPAKPAHHEKGPIRLHQAAFDKLARMRQQQPGTTTATRSLDDSESFGPTVSTKQTTAPVMVNGTKGSSARSRRIKPPEGLATNVVDPQQQIDDLRLSKLSLRDVNQINNDNSPKKHLTKQSRTTKAQKQQQRADNEAATTQEQQTGSTKVDMECARQKLMAQVEKHPFWSNKAARRMQLTGLKLRHVYIYELVSFCERRDLEWRYEPYRGGLVPSIPFRRVDPITGRSSGSISQPATPSGLDLTFAQRQLNTITVPGPLTGGGVEPTTCPTSPSAEQLQPQQQHSLWSTDSTPSTTTAATAYQRSPISRSFSGGATATGQPCGALYEPMSAIERPVPSAELVWSIEAPAHVKPEPFVGCAHSTELPNSSFVKRCHGCQGRGRLKCTSCYGVGYEVCISCSGRGTTKSMASSMSSANRSGRNYASDGYSRNSTNANGYDNGNHGSSSGNKARKNEPGGISGGSAGLSSSGSAWVTETCHFCHGGGQKRCWVCAGKSYNHCLGCIGTGQLRCYLNLNITWINHRDETILNNSDNIIPKDRLRLSSGLTLADDISDKLSPLGRARIDGATGSVEESNQLHIASKRLLERHSQAYKQEKLLRQRHRVTQIECHVVNYEWKQRRGHFVIYGDERKVYIAKYPFKSFCNIT